MLTFIRLTKFYFRGGLTLGHSMRRAWFIMRRDKEQA